MASAVVNPVTEVGRGRFCVREGPGPDGASIFIVFAGYEYELSPDRMHRNLRFENRRFTSPNHIYLYLMAKRYGTADEADKVGRAKTTVFAKSLVSQLDVDVSEWREKFSLDAFIDAYKALARSSAAARKAILDTKGKTVREAVWNTTRGIGLGMEDSWEELVAEDVPGNNHTGRAIEAVRLIIGSGELN